MSNKRLVVYLSVLLLIVMMVIVTAAAHSLGLSALASVLVGLGSGATLYGGGLLFDRIYRLR